ncbi:MAG: peroxiredoxin-like family protein [Pirellulales bacterium]
MSIESVIAETQTVAGSKLGELSQNSPVLLVFLRHSGCPFCRETLSDLRRQQASLNSRGIKLVIVHQDTPERGAAWIDSYKLQSAEQISDPNGELYRNFELGRSTWWNLLGPHVWWAGFRASILKMHGVAKIVGDIKQLTGSFLIHRGKIVRSFRQRYSGDRPRYAELTCETPP